MSDLIRQNDFYWSDVWIPHGAGDTIVYTTMALCTFTFPFILLSQQFTHEVYSNLFVHLLLNDRKVVKQPRKADGSDYDSDDERAYKKLPAPDPDAPDYFMDEVDEFNENKDKILLEGDNKEDEDSDSEDQVCFNHIIYL